LKAFLPNIFTFIPGVEDVPTQHFHVHTGGLKTFLPNIFTFIPGVEAFLPNIFMFLPGVGAFLTRNIQFGTVNHENEFSPGDDEKISMGFRFRHQFSFLKFSNPLSVLPVLLYFNFLFF